MSILLSKIMNENKYLTSIKNCKHIAKKEYQTVQRLFEKCDNIINDLSHNLQNVISLGSQTLSTEKMLEDGLANILYNLENDYKNLLTKRNINLAKQKQSLDCFNVMLFGKTM